MKARAMAAVIMCCLFASVYSGDAHKPVFPDRSLAPHVVDIGVRLGATLCLVAGLIGIINGHESTVVACNVIHEMPKYKQAGLGQKDFDQVLRLAVASAPKITLRQNG